jgi:hypothetical protein
MTAIEPYDIGQVVQVSDAVWDGPAIATIKDGQLIVARANGKLSDGWINRGNITHDQGVAYFTVTHRAEDDIVALHKNQDEKSSSRWQPIDLTPYLDPDRQRPVPAILPRRDDGVCLFYKNKVHWLSGEPESGKSFLAQIAVAEEISAGNDVMYLDFEDDPDSVSGRLLALGATPEDISAHVHYYSPDLPASKSTLQDAVRLAANCTIIVIDGVNDGMGRTGANPNSSTEFYTWWNVVGDALHRASEAAIIVIDHVVKDKEQRQQYASGTIQKSAKTHVHFRIDLARTFGEGMTGRAHVRLLKDKPGGLKRFGGGWKQGEGQPFASFTIESKLIKTRHGERFDTRYAVISDSSAASGKFRPTVFMERISEYLARPSTSIPASKSAIEDGISGDNNAKRVALDIMITEGYVERVTTTTKGGTHDRYKSIKPYKQAEDPEASSSVNPIDYLRRAAD